MNKPTLWLIAALLFSGCASLTRTQIDSVNRFSETCQNFSAFPDRIITELALIKKESRIFYANSLIDREQHIQRLDRIYTEIRSDYSLSGKVDISFKIIDKYAQALMLLSSETPGKDLEKQSAAFGIGIDSLITVYNTIEGIHKIPAGIGKAAGELIAFGGRHYIRSRQAGEIKKYVARGDTLIEIMTGNLLAFLEKKIYIASASDSLGLKDLIANQKTDLKEEYGMYLTSVLSKNQLPPLESDTKYVELMSRLDDLSALRRQTISATRALRKAHGKLNEELKKRKTGKETIKELQGFYEEMKTMKSILSEINNAKQ